MLNWGCFPCELRSLQTLGRNYASNWSHFYQCSWILGIIGCGIIAPSTAAAVNSAINISSSFHIMSPALTYFPPLLPYRPSDAAISVDQVSGVLLLSFLWPSFGFPIKPYIPVSVELKVQDGVLMQGSRIMIQAPLQLEMLDRLHTGHQGITKCREKAWQSMW